MKHVSPQTTVGLEDQATVIANEIFNLINQYTHDSGISKFFLTDDIAYNCYLLAGGFASLIYSPALDPDELPDSAILSYIYALLTYGFNIYIKERSLLTNAAPYVLPTNKTVIKQLQKKTLDMTDQGKLYSTPLADKIISIILLNVQNNIELDGLKIRTHTLQVSRFNGYSKLSLYWGYNFALQLIEYKKKAIKQ